MKMLLELVPVPVGDVERAKAFYTEKLGFAVDVDIAPADGVRIVQLTPEGSACSIMLSSGLPALAGMAVGSVRGLHLVVADARAAGAELAARGAEVGEPELHPGDMVYVGFTDPDGNSWVFQEMPWRAGDFG